LNSYAQVNKKNPITLLIVGDVRAGEDKKTFDELKASIPNENIIVTGYVAHKDLPAYYSLMDVFVHPSLRDGTPNAVLEALACEKAVIATPVGGARNIIENETNGIFVNVNDVGALAEALDDLLDNPEKRERLGKAARETIVNGFTPEMELKANLEIYRIVAAS
jgi:glycosyltransferase involved in cell wall biosynthesis